MSKEGSAGPAPVIEGLTDLLNSDDPRARETIEQATAILLTVMRGPVEVKVGDKYPLKHPVTVEGTEYTELTLAKEANTRTWVNAKIAAENPEEVESFVLAEMYGVPIQVIWALWPKDTKELLRRQDHFFL